VILNLLLFGELRREVLAKGATSASFGMAYWFVIGACVGAVVVPILAIIECCAGRIKRWRQPKGEYIKIDTPGESQRNSTYRQSAYELPLFDMGDAHREREMGVLVDSPAGARAGRPVSRGSGGPGVPFEGRKGRTSV
jgi:hypothetical protein